MPETVSIREDLQIIHVDSYGDITVEDLKTSLNTILRFRKERGLTRVLVDATKETSLPSTLPIFEFGKDFAARVRGMSFALVAGQVTRDRVELLETVAINRGADVEMFDTTDAALAWLTEDPSEEGN
jgi:hypothetical protein